VYVPADFAAGFRAAPFVAAAARFASLRAEPCFFAADLFAPFFIAGDTLQQRPKGGQLRACARCSWPACSCSARPATAGAEAMKITEVEVLELEALVPVPWRIATASLATMGATVVRLQSDEGLVGIGECIVRLGPGVTGAVVREVLAPLVMGRDPFEAEAIWEDMFRAMRARGHSRGFHVEAMSGVDMAVWDLIGRKLGLPVARVLAGHGRARLPAYASSILLASPPEMAQVARGLVARGFRAIKMKVGEGLREDLPRMEAVRAAVGPGVDVMLDANSGYDAPTAIAVGREAERLGMYWLEEPVPPDDLPGYRRVRRALGALRLAAGESEFTAAGVRELLAAGVLDVVQPDVARAGGFTGCRRIAALASAWNVAVAPHTGASGALCIAASLQLGAAVSGFLVFEHMFLDNPLRAILTPRLPEPVGGWIDVPQRPGLGFDLDEAAVRRFLRKA
jgi:L-alanine-DL-glutamate epimerase-like enolase superfamily enzyme